jgi:hypothetical protein
VSCRYVSPLIPGAAPRSPSLHRMRPQRHEGRGNEIAEWDSV